MPLKYLDGMDSLLSIVQMPAGVPVATVSVGGARNAGLLAARILAAHDAELLGRMREFQQELNDQATEKGKRLRAKVEGSDSASASGSDGAAVMDHPLDARPRAARRPSPSSTATTTCPGRCASRSATTSTPGTSPPTSAPICTPTSPGCGPAGSARSSGRCTCAPT